MSGDDDVDLDWEELEESEITKVMDLSKREELLNKLRQRDPYKRKSIPPSIPKKKSRKKKK